MANKTLFASLRDAFDPANKHGELRERTAYALAPKQALAQHAATRLCSDGPFYATADEQLTRVLELCDAVDAEFRRARGCLRRTQSFMKDMPALLCAWLAAREPRLHAAVFARVIDNARMLRTYVQILRSGVVGRSRWELLPSGWYANGLPAATKRSCSAPAPDEPVSLGHREDGSPEAGGAKARSVSMATCSAGPTTRMRCRNWSCNSSSSRLARPWMFRTFRFMLCRHCRSLRRTG